MNQTSRHCSIASISTVRKQQVNLINTKQCNIHTVIKTQLSIKPVTTSRYHTNYDMIFLSTPLRHDTAIQTPPAERAPNNTALPHAHQQWLPCPTASMSTSSDTGSSMEQHQDQHTDQTIVISIYARIHIKTCTQTHANTTHVERGQALESFELLSKRNLTWQIIIQ